MNDNSDKPIVLNEVYPHRAEVLEAMKRIYGNKPVLVKVMSEREDEGETLWNVSGGIPYLVRDKSRLIYASTAELLPFRFWSPAYHRQPPERSYERNEHMLECVKREIERVKKAEEYCANVFLTIRKCEGGKKRNESPNWVLDFSDTPQFKALMALWSGVGFRSLQVLKNTIKQEGLDKIIGDLFMEQPYFIEFCGNKYWRGIIHVVEHPYIDSYLPGLGVYELVSPDENQLKLDLRLEEKQAGK